MSRTLFEFGKEYDIAYRKYRFVPGSKPCRQPGQVDMRLEEWVMGRDVWLPVTLDCIFFETDAIGSNEDRLGVGRKVWMGGKYTTGQICDAYTKGWRVPYERLHRERKDYQERIEEAEWFNQDRDQGGAA